MPFSPDEIQNKEFMTTLRGYDKDEVQAFLSAVASDYRGALETRGTAPASFESLGQEVGSILQAAKDSATRLTVESEREAASTRKRIEEQSTSLREASTKAAARLKEEAERHSMQVRAEAEKYAKDLRDTAEHDSRERLRETQLRLDRLQSTESDLRQRLYSLEMSLKSMREELEVPGMPRGGQEENDREHGESGEPPKPPRALHIDDEDDDENGSKSAIPTIGGGASSNA